MFKSEFLNGEYVIISDRLAGLPLLITVFTFDKGKMFDGENLAPSASSSLPSGGDLFLRPFADALPSAAFFPVETGFVIPYKFRRLGPYSNFLGTDSRIQI
jgi:hypothetical protein